MKVSASVCFGVEGTQQHLGQEVLVSIMFKHRKTFLFSCCLEQYKLVNLQNTIERLQEIDACRKACWEYDMVLMPLERAYDRIAIVNLPEYNGSSLVITDGIDIVGNSSSSTFFSRPGGEQINFIHLASTIGKRQSDTPGTYSIVIYHDEYYSRDSVVDKDDKCACKLPGEWCLHSRNADFFLSGVCTIAMLTFFSPKTKIKLRSRNSTRTVSGHLCHSCSKFALLKHFEGEDLVLQHGCVFRLVVSKNMNDYQECFKFRKEDFFNPNPNICGTAKRREVFFSGFLKKVYRYLFSDPDWVFIIIPCSQLTSLRQKILDRRCARFTSGFLSYKTNE